MRRATLLAALVAMVAAPAALAQEPEDELDDEPVPEATATPAPGCERGPGTDADYAYCTDPCAADGADGDYAYADCVYATAGRPRRPRPEAAPQAAAQPLAAQTLPMTGAEPWLIGGAGAGFLLAGAGLRLRVRPR